MKLISLNDSKLQKSLQIGLLVLFLGLLLALSIGPYMIVKDNMMTEAPTFAANTFRSLHENGICKRMITFGLSPLRNSTYVYPPWWGDASWIIEYPFQCNNKLRTLVIAYLGNGTYVATEEQR